MTVTGMIGAAVKEVGTVAMEKVTADIEKIKDVSESGVVEVAKNKIENIKSAGDAVLLKLDDIKNMTPEQLKQRMEETLAQNEHSGDIEGDEAEDINKGITAEEKAKIKEETGWSDEIVDSISSMLEYEIYRKAGLVEAEIGGKKCLIRNDIDWEQKDAMGRTNKERVEQGLSPINKDGKVIELHHIGQHADSPLAELTPEEHRGKGNDTILHDKTKESEIDRQAFTGERNAHWEARANQGGQANGTNY